MTPYYSDSWLDIYQGDCRSVLAELPAESVHCVVTSPPYWGLRDYGDTGQLGLEPTPEEYVASMVDVFREVRRVLRKDGTLWLNLGSSYAGNPGGPQGATGDRADRTFTGAMRGVAGASGRSRSPQPERAPAYGSDGTGPRGSTAPGSAYSGLCDECRAAQSRHTTDTLRPLPEGASPLALTARDIEPAGSAGASSDAAPLDVPASMQPLSEPPPPGECSHCGNCGACLSVLRSASRDAQACGHRSAYSGGIASQSGPSGARTSDTISSGLAWGDYTSTLKPKDLVPIPWMVAMALQADGWYLRSDIIWSKPNPMPESVTDRPTKAHEYLFLLSKSPRYYYDADAVREPNDHPNRSGTNPRLAEPRNDAVGWARHGSAARGGIESNPAGRNLRSVWTIATQPYPGAHFATFPRKLVEPCIKAGTSEKGVCPECGAPWARVVEQERRPNAPSLTGKYDGEGKHRTISGGVSNDGRTRSLTGWEPSCEHRLGDDDYNAVSYPPLVPGPATILDPFAGSGTTGMVAQSLGRRAILIDLNADYLAQALTRNRDIPLGLSA